MTGLSHNLLFYIEVTLRNFIIFRSLFWNNYGLFIWISEA